jgi:hypothetical protein
VLYRARRTIGLGVNVPLSYGERGRLNKLVKKRFSAREAKKNACFNLITGMLLWTIFVL